MKIDKLLIENNLSIFSSYNFKKYFTVKLYGSR